VIVRKGEGTFSSRLPDGLENLTDHNLITFKSHQETLDDWALKELTGHYVNYRKQVSPTMQDLLPEEQFRLYAVSARSPQSLSQQALWTPIQEGVYECRRGTDAIRVLVLGELACSENNAMLHLLSASQDRIRYGAEHYKMHSDDTSSFITQLFKYYEVEGVKMPYTIEDFRREYVKDHRDLLSPEERVEGLTAEQRLKGLSPEELLKGLSPQEKEAMLKKLQSELHRQS
jgi:hypothetical protein